MNTTKKTTKAGARTHFRDLPMGAVFHNAGTSGLSKKTSEKFAHPCTPAGVRTGSVFPVAADEAVVRVPTPIERALDLIRPILETEPGNWTASQAFNIGFIPGRNGITHSPEFISITPSTPSGLTALLPRSATAEQRDAKRKARNDWRAEMSDAARRLAERIYRKVSGVAVRRDGWTLDVSVNADPEEKKD